MKDTSKLEALGRVYRAERRSFVRYLVDEAAPTAIEDSDRTVGGLLAAWSRQSRSNVERVDALLEAAGASPSQGSWPLGNAQYNFLSGAYLLQPVEREMTALVERLEGELDALRGWPEAEALVKEIAQGHRAQLGKLREIGAQVPKPTTSGPVTPHKRERSANWW